MNTFTFKSGSLVKGLTVQLDERLGHVVFLGEAGTGRRFEKVALDKFHPAEVINGKVLEAGLKKITLPARDGKPEKVFFLLEKPRNGGEQQVLVRVNTQAEYTKNTKGSWMTVKGNPETVIAGYGAHGIAGRIGNWNDGLVVMNQGDVLKVKPEGGHKTDPYALWVDENGQLQAATWKDYENLVALAEAEAKMAEAETGQLDLTYGLMPAFSWYNGNIQAGIKVSTGATGNVIRLGENGIGRNLVEVPIVGCNNGEPIRAAAVAILKKDGDKTIYGLVQSSQQEEGAFFVHISTQAGYTRDSNGRIKAWKGSDLRLIAQGLGAHGAAGHVCNWTDNLVVMREDDVIYAQPECSRITVTWAIFVKNGQLHTEEWADWKFKDAQRDPKFYIAKGTAPWGHVPQDWIGRVVTITPVDAQYGYEETGELISISPLVLNMGWDGRDRSDRKFDSGRWVKLEADKEAHRLEGAKLDERQGERSRAEGLLNQINEIQQSSAYQWAEQKLHQQFNNLVQSAYSFDTMPSGQSYGQGLGDWIGSAERLVVDYTENIQPELEDLHRRQIAGEILVDFSAWHRTGGMTQCGDGWVIRADGTHRERDEDNIQRHKSDGDYYWRLVAEDELALVWRCGSMRDVAGSSKFEVAKMPVGGCTEAQLQAVAAIEQSLEVPPNAFGLNADAQKEQEALMHEIREAARQSGLFRELPNLEFLKVTGPEGVYVDDNSQVLKSKVGRFANHGIEYPEEVAGRAARLVKQVRVASGVLEFLVYHKYGQWNMNIRWREGELLEETGNEPAEGHNTAFGTAFAKLR